MPARCAFVIDGDADGNRCWVRCEVCGARFRVNRASVPTLNGHCSGRSRGEPQATHPNVGQLIARGPGTELSKLLKRFGIEPTPTCPCRDKAAQMDAWGPDECERPERIDEVVAVMRAEAQARGLPFLDVVGRMLVKKAIKNARKSQS